MIFGQLLSINIQDRLIYVSEFLHIQANLRPRYPLVLLLRFHPAYKEELKVKVQKISKPILPHLEVLYVLHHRVILKSLQNYQIHE